MSLSAAMGYRWDGARARLFFQTCPDSYNTERLIAFLEDLRQEVRGQKGPEANWAQTIPGKGWNMLLHLYGTPESGFDKTKAWRVGEV